MPNRALYQWVPVLSNMPGERFPSTVDRGRARARRPGTPGKGFRATPPMSVCRHRPERIGDDHRRAGTGRAVGTGRRGPVRAAAIRCVGREGRPVVVAPPVSSRPRSCTAPGPAVTLKPPSVVVSHRDRLSAQEAGECHLDHRTTASGRGNGQAVPGRGPGLSLRVAEAEQAWPVLSGRSRDPAPLQEYPAGSPGPGEIDRSR